MLDVTDKQFRKLQVVFYIFAIISFAIIISINFRVLMDEEKKEDQFVDRNKKVRGY